MMRLLACLAILAPAFAAFHAAADVPPSYTPYGIGAVMEERDAFPEITKVLKGGPAELAGVKTGDRVIALNGSYSKAPMPFYYFARGLTGPSNSVAELILLRGQAQVLVIKVKRTVRS